MSGRHEDVGLDEPASAHRPASRFLELVMNEEFDNRCMTLKHIIVGEVQ